MSVQEARKGKSESWEQILQLVQAGRENQLYRASHPGDFSDRRQPAAWFLQRAQWLLGLWLPHNTSATASMQRARGIKNPIGSKNSPELPFPSQPLCSRAGIAVEASANSYTRGSTPGAPENAKYQAEPYAPEKHVVLTHAPRDRTFRISYQGTNRGASRGCKDNGPLGQRMACRQRLQHR